MSMSEISIPYLCVMLGYIVILLIIPIGLYKIFKKDIRSYVCIGVYLLGLMTRFVMGFSPTIYASGERTFTMLYISFIIGTVIILDKIYRDKILTIKTEQITDKN